MIVMYVLLKDELEIPVLQAAVALGSVLFACLVIGIVMSYPNHHTTVSIVTLACVAGILANQQASKYDESGQLKTDEAIFSI